MCRNSLWQEQTGSSMLHTFITTPKTYIIMIGANLCDPKELLQHTNMKHVHFVSGLFARIMLYLLLISAGFLLLVTISIDLRIQLDSFMTSSLSGAIPKHRCIVGNFNTYIQGWLPVHDTRGKLLIQPMPVRGHKGLGLPPG